MGMRRLSLPLLLLLLPFCSRILAQPDPRIAKIRHYIQDSGAAPSPAASNPFQFEFYGSSLGIGFSSFTLQLPSGSLINIPLVGADRIFSASSASAAELNAVYGSGTYAMTASLSGFPLTTSVQLGADAYPVVPRISNHAATQTIPAPDDFEFEWDPFTGAGPDDAILVNLRNVGGLSVYQDFIDGSATSFLLPGETLGAGDSYELEVAFLKVIDQAEPDIGLPFASAFASSTRLGIRTAGSGGGDSTPPFLASSSPFSGGTLASATTPVVFTFSEPMDPSRIPVAWMAYQNGQLLPLEAGLLTYAWSAGNTVLSCRYDATGAGWPANLTVSWNLPGQSAGFRDVAGNPLVSANGLFGTPSGSIPDCDADPVDDAHFSLSRMVHHLQTSSAVGGINPTNQAVFNVISSISNSPGRAAIEYSVGPNRQLRLLTPIFGGTEFLQQSFPTEAALDAAFPPGAYLFQLRDRTDTNVVLHSVSLNLPANLSPPIPRFANQPAAQTIPPNADFTLSWDAFPGATPTHSHLSIVITDESDEVVLELPDSCNDLPLSVSATSVVIPANLLPPGRTFLASLSFFRLSDIDKSLPGTDASGVSVLGRSTSMLLRTTGGSSGSDPILRNLTLNGSQLEITVDATVGKTFTLLRADSINGPFTGILSTNPPAATFQLNVPIGADSFFRGQSAP
jgi:hypothetical protein